MMGSLESDPMAYAQLYDDIQSFHGKISTNYIRERVSSLTRIRRIKEQWSGELDARFIRGFYIEGPLGPPANIGPNEVLIVLARELDKHMRRIVLTKELMHTFDEDEELTDTAEKFDSQVERLLLPGKAPSPPSIAEAKAFWRAHGVLCSEERRRAYEKKLIDEEITLPVIAAALQIPVLYVRNYFRADFLSITKAVG
jgi:hypothetical protein